MEAVLSSLWILNSLSIWDSLNRDDAPEPKPVRPISGSYERGVGDHCIRGRQGRTETTIRPWRCAQERPQNASKIANVVILLNRMPPRGHFVAFIEPKGAF